MAPSSHLPLFGGVRAWNKTDWTPSDDRVRGGASTSTLTCSPSSLTALFHGTLDITALGGAGFASQRTAGAERVWDLSGYDGLEIVVDLDRTDGKTYTFTVKDEILPRREDGRQRSSVSWEVDFSLRGEAELGRKTIFVRWDDLRPTFRGREVEGVEPLDLGRVRRFGVMIRSFFGEQEGEFKLGIVSIAALRTARYLDYPEEEGEEEDELVNEKMGALPHRRGWFGWLTACLGF